MKRIRPVWAVVAAACALVVLASIVASISTGMGWWNWQSKTRNTRLTGTQVTAQHQVRWNIDRGGIYYAYQQDIPILTGIPIVGNFFQIQTPAAWVPRVSITSGHREIIVPFWMIGAVALAGCVLAWRRARHAAPGECIRCRYDLTGLGSNGA